MYFFGLLQDGPMTGGAYKRARRGGGGIISGSLRYGKMVLPACM